VEKQEDLMSPFDFFKKSPKKEAENQTGAQAAQPSMDETFKSPEMQKKRHEAATDFLKAFQERMPLVHGKPHAGTVLAVAARLAGTSLYRSLNDKNDVAPGVIVLSEEVNQAWPPLMNMFAHYCKQNGLDVMAKPVVTEFPEKDKPVMDTDQVLQEYQDQYHNVMKKHGLDYLNGAYAGMIVTSIIFEYHTKRVKDVDPHVAAGIVAMGIVEGAKTAPPLLGEKPKSGVKKMSRLVLGETDAAREEALATDAIYIEIHPEALKMLQQKNVDPYLVYEQGVRKQMEERIARIDFVKADVDALFNEWRAKPQAQAPIHVRLIFWLKENASTHGYEQIGNSWILK
jgi:hypothetical protein